jgi:hypothetical protein
VLITDGDTVIEDPQRQCTSGHMLLGDSAARQSTIKSVDGWRRYQTANEANIDDKAVDALVDQDPQQDTGPLAASAIQPTPLMQ